MEPFKIKNYETISDVQLAPKITITSMATNTSVQFFPYDFDFEDMFKPEWNQYDAFGRMDPVMIYKKTTRDMSVSFNIVSEKNQFDGDKKITRPSDAKQNFDKLQTLLKMLYPVYDGIQQVSISSLPADSPGLKARENAITENNALANMTYGPQTIKASPLMTINFANLLNNDDYVVAITNFKHKFKFDTGNTMVENGKAYPGVINISMNFKVLHTSVVDFRNYQFYK